MTAYHQKADKPARGYQDKPFAVIDSETDPFAPGRLDIEPFVWGFFDGSEYRAFQGPTATADLVDFIRQWDGVIYAHNGGKFDYHFLIPYFEPGSILIINGRIAKVKIGKAQLRDSYNILPVSLKKMKKDDFDYSKMERDVRSKYMPEILAYLESDCRNLFEYVFNFRRLYGSSLTLAGSSMKYWGRLGGIIPRTTRGFYEDVHPHYFGGRVEAFAPGVHHGKLKILDINSAYPYAMTFPHPISKKNAYFVSRRAPTRGELERGLVTVECMSRGALPKRKYNGAGTPQGIEFPHARDVYTVTGWEYLAGVDTGTIEDVENLRVWVFPHTTDFKPYVEHFYEEKARAKATGDHPGYVFAKLFMNSLYGKFAANPENYDEHRLGPAGLLHGPDPDEQDSDNPDGWKREGGRLGKFELWAKPLNLSKARYYNLATAASITGFVRAYLWRAICGARGVVYCDTDSLICEGFKGDVGDRLGQWSLEADADVVAVGGKKIYAAFKQNKCVKLACKGARLKPEQIIDVARGAKIRWKSDVPTFSLKNDRFFVERIIQKTY